MAPFAMISYKRMEATMMARRLRPVFIALATLAVCASVQWSAQAQAPGRTIKFIITNPAGGVPDTVARVVGRRLQERLGQTVVVENRSGANRGIAVNALIGSPADGQTFVVTDGAILSVNQICNEAEHHSCAVQGNRRIRA